MASLRDAPTPEREAVFWTGALVNAALGVLGGLVLWWCGYYLLGSYFGAQVSPGMQEEVRAALPWLAVAVPVATLSAVCVAALEARERFLVLNGLQVSTAALFQLLPGDGLVAGARARWIDRRGGGGPRGSEPAAILGLSALCSAARSPSLPQRLGRDTCSVWRLGDGDRAR